MTGSGTQADPYIISDVTDLQNMNLDLTAYYELANDIDASGTAAWNGGEGFVPIGSSVAPFQGQFDGKGYTITSLTIDRAAETLVGLFGLVVEVGSALTIKDVTISGASITGDDYTGAIAGLIQGDITVSGCTVSGTISAGDSGGGIVGDASMGARISDCASTCTVGGDYYVAGIVGNAYNCTINKCLATGTLTGKGHVGGIAGNIDDCTLSECGANVDATSTRADNAAGHVGALVGYLRDSTIENCYGRGSATGDDGNSSEGVGGLVGSDATTASSTYTDSFAATTVSGHLTGGLIGYMDSDQTFSDCCWDTTTGGAVGVGESNSVSDPTISGIDGYTRETLLDDGIVSTLGWTTATWDAVPGCNGGYPCLRNVNPCCMPHTQMDTIGDHTIVTEKPVLELIRNVEVQLDGRFYIDKNGNAIYESRFHRSG